MSNRQMEQQAVAHRDKHLIKGPGATRTHTRRWLRRTAIGAKQQCVRRTPFSARHNAPPELSTSPRLHSRVTMRVSVSRDDGPPRRVECHRQVKAHWQVPEGRGGGTGVGGGGGGGQCEAYCALHKLCGATDHMLIALYHFDVSHHTMYCTFTI